MTGREPVGVHDLRHSFVAVALAAGLTLPEAAALARHANPRVTATIYAGLTDAARAGLGAKLPRRSERRRVATMATLTVRSGSDACGRIRENPCKLVVSANGRERARTLAH